jgi:hypothetical protein
MPLTIEVTVTAPPPPPPPPPAPRLGKKAALSLFRSRQSELNSYGLTSVLVEVRKASDRL